MSSVTFSATRRLDGGTSSLITERLRAQAGGSGTVGGSIKRSGGTGHNDTGSSGVISDVQPGHGVAFKTVTNSFGGGDCRVVVFTAGNGVGNLGGTGGGGELSGTDAGVDTIIVARTAGGGRVNITLAV